MSQNNKNHDDDVEICSYCGKIFVNKPLEVDHEKRTVVIPKLDEHYVVAEVESGEVIICEDCYSKRDSFDFSLGDLYEIHYQFGIEYLFSSLHDRSLEAFEKAAGISRTPDILSSLAFIYLKTEKLEEATTLLREALSLNPDHEMSLLHLLRVLIDQGELIEALKLTEKAFEQASFKSDVLMDLAEILFKMGNQQQANECYQAAKKMANCPTSNEYYDDRWENIAAKG